MVDSQLVKFSSKIFAEQDKLLTSIATSEQFQSSLLEQLSEQKRELYQQLSLCKAQKTLLFQQQESLQKLEDLRKKRTDILILSLPLAPNYPILSDQDPTQRTRASSVTEEWLTQQEEVEVQHFRELEEAYFLVQNQFNSILKDLGTIREKVDLNSLRVSSKPRSSSSPPPASPLATPQPPTSAPPKNSLVPRRMSFSPSRRIPHAGNFPHVDSISISVKRASKATGMDLFMSETSKDLMKDESFLKKGDTFLPKKTFERSNCSLYNLQKKFGVTIAELKQKQAEIEANAQLNYRRTEAEGFQEMKRVLQEREGGVSKKVFEIVGHNPQKQKLMNRLGIEDERELERILLQNKVK